MRLAMDIGGTNLKLGLINDQGTVEKHEMHKMEDILSHSNFIEALILYFACRLFVISALALNPMACGLPATVPKLSSLCLGTPRFQTEVPSPNDLFVICV